MNIVEGYAGKRGTGCDSAAASRCNVGSFAKTHVQVLRRDRPRAVQAEFETTAGGPSLKLYAAARISLRPASAGRVRFRIVKNKAAASFASGELLWAPSRGFTESL